MSKNKNSLENALFANADGMLNEVESPVSANSKAALIRIGAKQSQVNLTSPQVPFTAVEMLDLLERHGVKTGEISAALSVTPNRWSTLTKRSLDGRDMQYEYITPPLEIYLRLIDAYPEYAPWRKISPSDVLKLSGWSKSQLAIACGSTEGAVERWLTSPSHNIIPQVSQLLNQIYVLLKGGVNPSVVLKVSDSVRVFRNNHPISQLSGSTWNSFSDQTYRKVRKILRSCINSLDIDGQGKMSDQESKKIIDELIRDMQNNCSDLSAISTDRHSALNEVLAMTKTLKDLKNTAHVDDVLLDGIITQIIACVRWVHARNTYQKVQVNFLRLRSDEQTSDKHDEVAFVKGKFQVITDFLSEVTSLKIVIE